MTTYYYSALLKATELHPEGVVDANLVEADNVTAATSKAEDHIIKRHPDAQLIEFDIAPLGELLAVPL